MKKQLLIIAFVCTTLNVYAPHRHETDSHFNEEAKIKSLSRDGKRYSEDKQKAQAINNETRKFTFLKQLRAHITKTTQENTHHENTNNNK